MRKLKPIQNALAISTEPTTEIDLDGKVLVRIHFQRDAAIQNVVDLKTWSSIWHDIGRGVAMIHDSPPEEVRVVGAGRGSVILELAVIYAIATTISKVMLEALKVTEKVLDIRKKAEEIKALKLSNIRITRDLEAEAEAEKTKGIQRISELVLKAKRKKDASEGDKEVAFDKAVKNLVNFLEKGGEIDCVVPDEEVATAGTEAVSEHQSLKELRSTFKQIRYLESHLKQLGDGAAAV